MSHQGGLDLLLQAGSILEGQAWTDLGALTLQAPRLLQVFSAPHKGVQRESSVAKRPMRDFCCRWDTVSENSGFQELGRGCLWGFV